METTHKDSAVGVKAWGGTTDGIGIGQSPWDDLNLLISDTTAGDLKVVLGSVHGVMGAVQEKTFD